MTTHSDERNYTCTRCPNTYKTLPSLKRHYSTAHIQIRPYTCTICHVNSSRLEHYKTHTQSQQHAQNIAKQSGAKTSEKVQHHLPSNSLITNRSDSPESIKNKTQTHKKSEFPGKKAAKNVDTGEKPKAVGSIQLEKAGILNSEKSSNPTQTHPELSEQRAAENISEQCPTNNTENQEQNRADIEHERTPTTIKALHLRQPFTNNAAELDTTCAWIETFPSDQNSELFLNDTILDKMAWPGLMHQVNNDDDDVTNSPNYTYYPLFYKETSEALKDGNRYNQQVTPQYSNLAVPVDLTKKLILLC